MKVPTYEFIFKQNAVRVAYCAESFENDGGLLSSIVKSVKRVMAAEFSRVPSVKVHTGQCGIASLGFRYLQQSRDSRFAITS